MEPPIDASSSRQSVRVERPRIVLPKICRELAIYSHHLSYYGGHFGCAKTLARLVVCYWSPGTRRGVKAYLVSCAHFLARAPFARASKWLSVPVGTAFEVVAVGLSGLLRQTHRGNTHNLVLVDHHTRWGELVLVPEPSAALVAETNLEY